MAKNGLRWRTWVEKVNDRRSGCSRRGHLSARHRPPGAFSWRNLTNLNLTKTITQVSHTPWPGGRRIIQCASARTAATVPLFALWSFALEALELENNTEIIIKSAEALCILRYDMALAQDIRYRTEFVAGIEPTKWERPFSRFKIRNFVWAKIARLSW